MSTRITAAPARRTALLLALAASTLSLSCGANAKQVRRLEQRLNAAEQRNADLTNRVADLEQQNAMLSERYGDVDKLPSTVDDNARRLEQLEQARAEAERPTPKRYGPDRTIRHNIPIAGAPAVGPAHAKVTIIEGFEFACQFCRRADDTMAQLRELYGNDLRIVYKSYIVHKDKATLPALAACAAHNQGKYEAFRKLAWELVFDAQDYSRDNLIAVARKAGVKKRRFIADLDGDLCRASIDRDHADLAAAGVGGTPGFFINGRFVAGAQPIETFQAIIDPELAIATSTPAAKVPLKDYYRWVLTQPIPQQ